MFVVCGKINKICIFFGETAVKKLLILILIIGAAQIAAAEVTLKVYESDGETPFDSNEYIMVGEKLSIIVSSDSNDFWSGGLFIAGEDRDLGTLIGRGLDPNDPNSRDYADSHYDEAGDFAIVTKWQDSSIFGFDLYTFSPVDANSADNSTVAGNWFIIDYKAEGVGDCNVGFYEYIFSYNSPSWTEPNYSICFSHSPTRDLNFDEKVNFNDFAIFASPWQSDDCIEPNWCGGADIDRDGDVDSNDLAYFADYWLWPLPKPSTPNEPNEPNDPNQGYQEDPNIIYSIVDSNNSNEITIDVNESITLYIKMETTEDGNVAMFDIEVNISDTNLGSIDNTPYDPNDPNASTAQILAEPRLPWADYWGPGQIQEEGIEFFAVNLAEPINDGNLASFVFTCKGQGDVTLELINHQSLSTGGASVYPKLVDIIIHQVDPYSQQMMGGGGEEMYSMQEDLSLSEEVIDIDKLVDFLEEIWEQDEEIRELFSEAEWQEFIDSVENSDE